MVPERNYLIHPTAVIMILVMTGLSVVFLTLGFAYAYVRTTRGAPGPLLPPIFLVTTVILLGASAAIHRWTQAFRRRDERGTIRWGWATLALTISFLAGQVMAWRSLLTAELMPGTSPGIGYLYALSILHVLHVFGGIPFLLRVIITMSRAAGEGTMALVFLDDRLARRVQHTAWYWHFLDALWLYIVGFLLVNSLV